ncbi:unnamed protein product [Clonostachys rosea f. rosea IK726]|uniref:Uncharacterized protein n=1 Tax=Clonostachys rosea f. rosea IK726 TaxID=1349383 RepID=A0ACA9UGT3_BIOOC|nr:unnamed protein product [Clonostachys rosea f. rosea IK726]
MDALIREMAECYSDTRSNTTKDYGVVLEGIEEALDTFWDMCSVFDVNETTDQEDSSREAIEKIHRKLVSTVHFFAMKLEGLESFVADTQSRLEIQRKMIKTIISQKNMKLVDKLAAERRNGGFIDQNWNKTPVTKLPAVFGSGYMFVFLCVLSSGFLAIKLVNLLFNRLLSVPLGLRSEGDSEGQYEGPSMRPVDVIVYILSLIPMAVFITLLYKSGRRKGATIKEWGMEESQDGSKEGSLPTNGELQK